MSQLLAQVDNCAHNNCSDMKAELMKQGQILPEQLIARERVMHICTEDCHSHGCVITHQFQHAVGHFGDQKITIQTSNITVKAVVFFLCI